MRAIRRSQFFILAAALMAGIVLFTGCNFPRREGPNTAAPTLWAGATSQPVPATSTGVATPAPVPPTGAGLVIIYNREGNVWRWTEASGPKQISQSGAVIDMEISDDGSLVVFSRQIDEFHYEIWKVNIDGTGEGALVSAPQLEGLVGAARDPNAKAVIPYIFLWQPGTHMVVFNTQETYEGPGQGLHDNLAQVNADTGEITPLLGPGSGGVFYHSPDGKQVAIVTPTTISLANSDGTNVRANVLDYPQVTTYSEYEYYARPFWSADSSRLRAAIPPANALDHPDEPTIIYEIPTDGSPARELTRVVSAPFFYAPVMFSPDLNRLAYLKVVGENTYELHIANTDGSSDVVFLTAPMVEFKGWGFDSSRFMYTAGGDPQIQLATVGGQSQPLAPGSGTIVNIRWLDADRFLHLVENDGQMALYLTRVGGESELIDGAIGFPSVYDIPD